MRVYRVLESRCDSRYGYLIITDCQWWSNTSDGSQLKLANPHKSWTDDRKYFDENRTIDLLVEAVQ